MAVTDKHPQYLEAQNSWQIMQDASSVAGEDIIKCKSTTYLPKSAGQIEAAKLDDALGKEIYEAYLMRAQYPLWVQDSVRTMVGLVSKLNPSVQIPSALLKHLEDNATSDGFSLKQLLVRVVEQVLQNGRCGIYIDVDDQGKPFFALYDALSIINWKESSLSGRKDLNLVVLNEPHFVNSDMFSHETKLLQRVLHVDENGLSVELYNGTIKDDKTPMMGNNKLNFVPFVFVGAIDNSPCVGTIPLLTMAKAAIKYYQLSADYFQSLHHTAHPQPYVTGLDDDQELTVTGVMAAWSLPKDSTCGYMEIDGTGIESTKKEMSEQKSAALEAGAKVLDVSSQESGAAREARQTDQHASLHSIVMRSAEAIEQALKYAAEWLNLNPADYTFSVVPEFSSTAVDTTLSKQLYDGALAGKNSYQTYWEYIATGKLPERSYDDELKLLENESMNNPNALGYTPFTQPVDNSQQ